MNKKATTENTENDANSEDVKIVEEESSVAEFTKHRVPTEQEEEAFEEYVDDEERDEEIEESLNEIYQDDRGRIVDVKKMEIKKGRGYIFRFFQLIFICALIAAAACGAYYYFVVKPGADVTAVEFRIDGPADIAVNEEMSYSIYYKNASNIAISNARIEAVCPENFQLVSTAPPASGEKNMVWEIPLIAPQYSGIITVKGRIIGPKGKTVAISASLSYKPDSLTSEFKKEATFASTIKDIGIDYDFDNIPNALVGETNEIVLRFNAKNENHINNFRLIFVPQDNIEFMAAVLSADSASSPVSQLRPGVWQVSQVTADIQSIPIRFKFTKKINPAQDIQFTFDTAGSDGQYYTFAEEKMAYEVMKNDLNMTLIMNGSRDNQGIEFGQTLNYSITYLNKGDADMKGVVIMAVIDGNLVNWNTLKDEPKGQRRGNTIIWTQEQIPGLAELKQNQEGTIDFSVDAVNVDAIESGRDYKIDSYATFSVGTSTADNTRVSAENRSNTITSQVNSDLKLDEAIRYFSEDNIPVGTGPHPPVVGQVTSYKVYWTLANSLHELSNLNVSAKLPDYVAWSGKENVSAGNISYNDEAREVVWDIGRLPATVMQATAEFSISITPGENDYNKIMVLLPGSTAKAVDTVTSGNIEKTTKAETTKLNNDDIATGDGIVGR